MSCEIGGVVQWAERKVSGEGCVVVAAGHLGHVVEISECCSCSFVQELRSAIF
jgi:hypothetical protein